MSDSLYIEMTGIDPERLKQGLRLCPSQSVTNIEQQNNELVIFWSSKGDKGSPMSVKPDVFVDCIIDWLLRNKGSSPTYHAPDFGKEPDIDGDCKRGWKLVGNDEEIRIAPHWMIYHK